tara:strand:+ start:8615 stop:9382 length:768 start_codon:yes stop_codon:yes gene_type:complete
MLEDLKTLLWFLLKGPKFYPTMFSLILRKFLPFKDSLQHKELERSWCEKHSISLEECVQKYGFTLPADPIFSNDYIIEVENRLNKSRSNFGGQGHIDLLYIACEGLKATKVVETGVAYGWSSSAILKSLSKRSGKLISVDMPMMKQTDYHLIGTAVHEENLKFWDLIREPDKFGLRKAIKKHGDSFDIAHYDSDKSYYGRKWSQPLIWKHLKKGGIFISDDIEDNSAFREFVEENQIEFCVLEFEGKYVGMVKKY